MIALFVTINRPLVAEEPRRTVSLLIEEMPNHADSSVVEAVRAHLADLPVRLSVEHIRAFPQLLREQISLSHKVMHKKETLAVVWADLSTDEDLLIYVSEPYEGNTLVREVVVTGNSEDNRLEIYGIVVRSTISALLQGGRIGVDTLKKTYRKVDVPRAPSQSGASRKTSEKITSEENTPVWEGAVSERRRRPGFGIRLGYGIGVYDRDMTIFQYVRNEISISPKGPVRLYAAYRFQPTVKATAPSLTMRINHHPFEVGVDWSKTFRIFGVSIGISVLNDPINWVVDIKRYDIAPATDTFRWLVGVTPSVKLYWRLTKNLEFFVAFCVDIYFNEEAATVDLGAERQTVIDPLDLRGHLALGMAFGEF